MKNNQGHEGRAREKDEYVYIIHRNLTCYHVIRNVKICTSM